METTVTLFSCIKQTPHAPMFLATIPHKNYETAHMKERLCLPSPLQSNVGCDKVQILLTVGLSTFNIACTGEGEQQHDVMSGKCLFHKFICKSQYIL